jgi:MoaA/NifB/PqqE/SkfB family radical SAM enzyme
MCLRENTPGDKTWFDETYLYTEFFQDRIPDRVMQEIETVLFNGVLGDPCAAPNFLEVCEVIRTRAPQAYITVSSNGGLRNKAFWEVLAKILGDKGRVVFAIDGLEDTNHIYRVNVNYNKVIENAHSFIKAGGNAEWQFITFKHNEHQVKEAELISKKLGFNNFFVKPSHRFTLFEMVGKELPVQPVTVIPYISKREWQEQSNSSTISCYAKRNQTIYIEHTGRLFPCCPLSSGQMYTRTIQFNDGWKELWAKYGEDKINLKDTDWDVIVDGPFFSSVANSWDKDYSHGRLAACAGVCSDSKVKFNHKD